MKKTIFGNEGLWLISRILKGKGKQVVYLDYPIDMLPRYTQGSEHGQIQIKIKKNDRNYLRFLKLMRRDVNDWGGVAIEQESDEVLFWNNGWLPPLDVMALYSLVKKYKPKKYVEIGSGVSTHVISRAIMKAQLDTEVISIDPEPRESVQELVDVSIRKPLQDCDLSVFDGLRKRDVVFLDGSHVLLMNSDVEVFFLEVLPRLKRGVVVQVHDIFWPYDYPVEELEYGEQYMLGMYLMHGMKSKQILFPGYYVSKNEKFDNMRQSIVDEVGLELDQMHGGSFWFEV